MAKCGGAAEPDSSCVQRVWNSRTEHSEERSSHYSLPGERTTVNKEGLLEEEEEENPNLCQSKGGGKGEEEDCKANES